MYDGEVNTLTPTKLPKPKNKRTVPRERWYGPAGVLAPEDAGLVHGQ